MHEAQLQWNCIYNEAANVVGEVQQNQQQESQ